MIKPRDETDDNWAGLCPDNPTRVCYEDGTSRELTTGDFLFTFGKHKGKRIDELPDVGYIKWLEKMSAQEDNPLLNQMCKLRLYELE